MERLCFHPLTEMGVTETTLAFYWKLTWIEMQLKEIMSTKKILLYY